MMFVIQSLLFCFEIDTCVGGSTTSLLVFNLKPLVLQATEMGIRIREMVYHKIKLNKILSRVTGKPYEQVGR